MGSRLFVAASSNRISTASTFTACQQTVMAAVVTVASLPGAGVYRYAFGLSSGTAARQAGLHLNGDNSGSLALLIGTNRINPSSALIPVADGRWYFLGASKPSGTSNALFFMYDYSTGTWSESASAGTFGDRTASAVVPSVGSLGAASYWDGRIAGVIARTDIGANPGASALMKIMAQGRHGMLSALVREQASNTNGRECWFFDLSTRIRLACWIHSPPSIGTAWTTGAIPAFDATSTPPGWG